MNDTPETETIESSLRQRAESLVTENPAFCQLTTQAIKQFHTQLESENLPDPEPGIPSPKIDRPLSNLDYLSNLINNGFPGHSIVDASVRPERGDPSTKVSNLRDMLRIRIVPDDKISAADPSRIEIKSGDKSVNQVDVLIRRMQPKDFHTISAEAAASSGGYVVDIQTTKVSWVRGDTGPSFTGGNGVRMFIRKDGDCTVLGKTSTGNTNYFSEKPIKIDPQEFGQAINQITADISNLKAI